MQVVDLVEGFLCLVGTVGCHTGVDGPLRESSNCEGRDNAEVISASAEGEVEVGVMRFGGVGDGSVGKNNLKQISDCSVGGTKILRTSYS